MAAYIRVTSVGGGPGAAVSGVLGFGIEPQVGEDRSSGFEDGPVNGIVGVVPGIP